jgi:hypothetical protein
MKLLVQFCLGLGCLCAGANAQVELPASFAAHSRSGQFTVYGERQSSAPQPPPSFSGNTNLVSLEPTLLAVSCERVKQALLRELGAPDAWRGRIHLRLHPAGDPDEPICVTSSRFTDGWAYQMELPDAVDPGRLVRALVRVLLLEWANRGGSGNLAEVPLWLSEGLSQDILTEPRAALVLQRPATGLPQPNTVPSITRTNPLARAHELLRGRPPLTFEQLSWLACLRAMLDALSRHLNWQTAFFQAFAARFPQPLDLEKWWALQMVQFVGRNLEQTWPHDEGLRRLDEILLTPIQFPVGTNQTPEHVEMTLQTILREWDRLRQSNTLQTKIQQLRMLRVRVSQPLTALVDDYRLALETCAQKIRRTEMVHTAHPPRPAVGFIIEETIKQLDALDARREALRESTPKAAQIQAGKTNNP